MCRSSPTPTQAPLPTSWQEHRATLTGCQRVLFAVHTVACATRLRLVAHLFANDPGVQVVFSAAPDELGRGVEAFLARLGAVTLPWQEAVREPFDLAVAASYGELHRLRAPVVVLPHGAGHNKLAPRQPGYGRPVAREVFGCDRERLVRHGRVVPSAIVLSHDEQLAHCSP